jgi:hypothetical protein
MPCAHREGDSSKGGRGLSSALSPNATTPHKRSIFARRRWVGAESSKSPGSDVSARTAPKFNSGKIRVKRIAAQTVEPNAHHYHGGPKSND